MGKDEMVRLEGVSFEAVALEHPIGFDVPLRSKSSDPSGLEFTWHLIQYVFSLPDPRSVTPITFTGSADDRACLHRFSSAATELVGSEFLRWPASMEISLKEGVESVLTNYPSRDVETGSATLLRQFLKAPEPASYQRVHQILWTDSIEGSPNRERLARWGRVHKKLVRRPPKIWVYQKATAGISTSPAPFFHHPSIADLMDTYCYGDWIHYGSRSADLATLETTEFDRASHRMTLYEGMAGLAAFYAGFAVLLECMVPALRTDTHQTS